MANPVSTTSEVTSPIPSMTCSGVSGSVSQNTVIPTIATYTHTFTRPVNTTGSVSTVPVMCMGLKLPGSRPPSVIMVRCLLHQEHHQCLVGLALPAST